MSKRSDHAPWVYESPDGGETVYRRHIGSLGRELIHESDRKRDNLQIIKEDKLWGEIRRKAKTDPALAQMLEEIQVYYTLRYSE
jgi:hypothetical protein